MKNYKSVVARTGVAALLAIGGLALASAPASATDCTVTVAYNTSAIYVSQRPNSCAGHMRSRVYWFGSPSGATMYSSTGSWVTTGLWSTASTSSSHYFAGLGRDWS